MSKKVAPAAPVLSQTSQKKVKHNSYLILFRLSISLQQLLRRMTHSAVTAAIYELTNKLNNSDIVLDKNRDDRSFWWT